MKTCKTINVPATTREVEDQTICDLCGCEEGSSKWDNSSCWDVDETEIRISVKHKDGYSYPECGSGTEYAVDMCPTCFKDKLIPWLESQGCTAERKEWDF